MLFFLEFSTFYDNRRFFLDRLEAKLRQLVYQLSRALEFSSYRRFSRRQESALFLSLQSVEVSMVFSLTSLNSLKNATISACTSLQLFILLSVSTINSCKKYLTLIDLLRPMHLGSNRNFIECWVRQVATSSISNYKSSMISSPISRIQRYRVSGTYSQQKKQFQSPISSKCYSLMRCQLLSVLRNPTIFLMIASQAEVLQTSFFLTTTFWSLLANYLSSPKGKPSRIYTIVQSLALSQFDMAVLLQLYPFFGSNKHIFRAQQIFHRLTAASQSDCLCCMYSEQTKLG